MTNETLRMQMLSGVITEGEYKAKLEEDSTKESLNENFVGMGMVGNIFDREKTDYELAFEHFTKGTSLNEEIEEEVEETLEEGNFDPTSYVEKSLIQVWNKGKADENMDFNSLAREIVTNLQP